MNTYIVGDIHGYSQSLRQLIQKLNPDPLSDRLILLGDLFDRGPDSWGVFQFVQSLAEQFGERFILLKGNHEDYLLTKKLTIAQKMMWNRVGRPFTAASFKEHGASMEDAAAWIREHCQDYYTDTGFQCVHACIKVDPIELNDGYTMFHDHETAFENQYAGPLTVIGHLAVEEPIWFTGDGQTITQLPYEERHPLPESGIICIDTGCGKGGRLTAMILSEGHYVLTSVPEEA